MGTEITVGTVAVVGTAVGTVITVGSDVALGIIAVPGKVVTDVASDA